MALIGLLGFIGCGKGTVGDVLAKAGFVKASFADQLKNVVSVMFGWDRVLLEGDTPESRTFRETPDPFWSSKFGYNFTPREALQKMGTESVRKVFNENFWVHSLENSMKPMIPYVITDVRFQNEREWIKSKGGIIIEVQRGPNPSWYQLAKDANSGSPSSERYMLTESGTHESEWRWINGQRDYLIENNGTIQDIEDATMNALFDFNVKVNNANIT